MNKQELQINELNSTIKAKIAPSNIHGIGVFAIFDIKKDEKIHADKLPRIYTLSYGSFGKIFTEVRELILERWPLIVNEAGFISPDVRLLTFMNHSSDPNYDAKTDEALRDISKGEEVTKDYRLMPNYKKVFKFLDI